MGSAVSHTFTIFCCLCQCLCVNTWDRRILTTININSKILVRKWI